jgi:hypothetical protein
MKPGSSAIFSSAPKSKMGLMSRNSRGNFIHLIGFPEEIDLQGRLKENCRKVGATLEYRSQNGFLNPIDG